MPRIIRVVTSIVGLVLLADSVQATMLLFDQSRDAATGTLVVPTTAGAALPGDYGDRVAGSAMTVPGGQFTYGNGGEGFTPNVVVDIFSDTSVALWTADYGDLENVVFGHVPPGGTTAPSALNVLLTADPGFEVQLHDFELAGWSNADYSIAGVSVFGGASTLFSQSDVLVQGNASGPRHTTFAFPTPLSAEELLIRIDVSNLVRGSQDNVGIDNVRFGQFPPSSAVPGPGTLGLLVPGAALLAGATRRRSRVMRAGRFRTARL